MKKIIPILFLFFFIFMCYIIYEKTKKESTYCLLIGDNNANYHYLEKKYHITEYNNLFTNKDYRIIDILNTIRYNEEQEISNKSVSIHQLIKKSNIIILSIGMNDIYNKLNDNTKEIYVYLNNMINNMELVLKEINKYHKQEVLVLGYYNITNDNNDIFNYINYKLKKITNKYKYQYIDLKNITNNKKYYQNSNKFYLNNQGYQQIDKLIVENYKKT